jgi:outer membrane protein OmpA-like peptidoglycan-associated protein
VKRTAWWVAIALTGLACAKYPVLAVRPDLYVLLPGATGSPGALSVTHPGGESRLDSPNSAASFNASGALQTGPIADAEVRQHFGAALDAQPRRPTSFTVYFLTDSDEVAQESSASLARMLDVVASYPAPEIVVIGHTDTVGSDEYNDRLSLQRAERLRSRLIERGIAATNITASGRGKRELLVPTADQVAEPRNRRVEIVVR